jgi:Wnt-binding factor required for Wnt secretion
VWLVFTIFLCRGRKDANGNKLSWSPEQKLVWWLSFLAIFFNDPAYAALALDNPPFGAAFLNGVFTVTFLTYLLVFFAIHFHLAALQGEWALGLSLTQSASAAVNRRAALGVPVSPNAAITGLNHPSLGMCFWLPKIMFATAFWIVSLTAFLYLRYKQLEDPAFGLWETVPAGFGTYVLIFLYLLATVYLLYVLVYAVIACRHYKRLRSVVDQLVASILKVPSSSFNIPSCFFISFLAAGPLRRCSSSPPSLLSFWWLLVSIWTLFRP